MKLTPHVFVKVHNRQRTQTGASTIRPNDAVNQLPHNLPEIRDLVRECNNFEIFHNLILFASDISYSSLTVGIPKEIYPGERRVSLTPTNAALLKKKGVTKVLVERGAGTEAQFLDEQYTAAGATLVSREELFASSDVMLKVRPPLFEEEAKHIKEGSTVISFLYPAQNKPLVELLASRKVDRCDKLPLLGLYLLMLSLSFAMDMIPRISRAQVFDALR